MWGGKNGITNKMANLYGNVHEYVRILAASTCHSTVPSQFTPTHLRVAQ